MVGGSRQGPKVKKMGQHCAFHRGVKFRPGQVAVLTEWNKTCKYEGARRDWVRLESGVKP